MRYTAQYFRDGLPEWKRRKDPVMVKLVMRPLSFYVSAFCANRGDGNLARSVKPQPFGGFVDSESSYILVALLGSCLGISAYNGGGGSLV